MRGLDMFPTFFQQPRRHNHQKCCQKLVLTCNRVTSNATTSPALLTNIQWVVKPRGDRAWRKAYAMFEQQYQSDSEPQVSSCYRSNYCPPKGSDANLPRLPKSSTAPQFKNTKWVVRPKSNSAWKKAQISFAQQKMTNVSNQLARDKTDLRFDRDNTFHLNRQWNKHPNGRCWGSPSGVPWPTAK